MKKMENITVSYLTRAEVWLCATILLYFLMNGAQLFETVVFVPKWADTPPDNFHLLLDGKGAGLKKFWIVFHSVHEIVFILAIVYSWKIDPVRNWLIVLFILHFAVRVWTVSYFAPNIIYFQKVATDPSLAKDLAKQTSLWQTLNYIRVAVFMAISVGLIPVCVKLFGYRN